MDKQMLDKFIASRRAKVANLADAGLSERAIADALGVSRSTVWNDKQAIKTRSRKA